jgi:hypothetical protein
LTWKSIGLERSLFVIKERDKKGKTEEIPETSNLDVSVSSGIVFLMFPLAKDSLPVSVSLF